MIYLDNAATTPLSPEALEEMMPFLREEFGNASTLYGLGRKAHAALERARERVARVINAQPGEVYFTSGGSEADTWALLSGHGHVITSKIEHHAVLNACRALEGRGVEVTYLDVDPEGFVSPEAVRAAIREDTSLISIMAANNEIGTLEPLGEIGALAREHGIPFHTDAVQAFARVPLDVEALNIDYLSASAHKIHGPKGVGMLYMRRGRALPPLIYGGAQERGRRAGTENVAGIAGFGRAAEVAAGAMAEWNERERAVRDRLMARLLAVEGCRLNGPVEKRLANNLNVSFSGVDGEELASLLNGRGIAAGTGSACASGAAEPSHVLKAIGRSHREAFSGLRLSVGHDTTAGEADAAATAVEECVARLRGRLI